MRALLKPYWILLFVVLPQILLIAIYSSGLSIIKSLLTDENIRLIIYFGDAILFGITASAIYSFICIVRKKLANGFVLGMALLAYYITFFVLYINYSDQILPWDIPQWMISSDDLMKYLITCLMPPVLYGLILLVLYFTPEHKELKAWVSFLSMVGIPLFWYLVFMAVMPIMRSSDKIWDYLFTMLVVISSVGFNFFLIRWIYVIVINKDKDFSEISTAAKVVIALVLPIIGLGVNQQMFWF